MSLQLSQLQQALNDAVDQIGGVDAAIEACDRMYSASFRSEPYRAAFSEGDVYEYQNEIIMSMYLKSLGLTHEPEYSSEHHFEAFYDDMERFAEHENIDRKSLLSEDEMVVDICNYKGECEDTVLYRFAKNLHVFRSKNESFFQVN